MRLLDAVALDVYVWNEESVVLTPDRILRLSMPATLVLTAAREERSCAELFDRALHDAQPIEPKIVQSALARAVSELVSMGFVALDPGEDEVLNRPISEG